MTILNGLKTISKPITSRLNPKFKRSFSGTPDPRTTKANDAESFFSPERLQRYTFTLVGLTFLYALKVDFDSCREIDKMMKSYPLEMLDNMKDQHKNK